MADFNYHNLKFELHEFGNCKIALRQIGEGSDLLLIHGFPTHGYTWRKILPYLTPHFRCHIVDLPGLGDSSWTKETDFSSEAQADRLIDLMQQLGIKRYAIAAHNSGATVSRIMALKQPEAVSHLVVFNTEMPMHRPPWIPFYQAIGLWPLVPYVIRQLLKAKWFVQSPMGFREFYSNKQLLKVDENISPYTNPVVKSHEKAIGAFKYLKGIDWKWVDRFEKEHANIRAEILFLWGVNDKTFPLKYALKMMNQFEGNKNAQLIEIKNASLLPHEEQPKETSQLMFDFLL